MLHECNVHCHSIEIESIADLGVNASGKWLPFCFNMDIVDAIKLTTDDPELPVYQCTSVFTHKGEVFIIDTPYTDFLRKYVEFDKSESEDGDFDDNIPDF